MRSGPEQNDYLEQGAEAITDIVDTGIEWAFGEEALSHLKILASNADWQKTAHVEEFKGDPDSTDYAIDLAAKNPTLLIEQFRAMTSPDMSTITPKQLDQVERQLERGTTIGGQDMLADLGESRDIYSQVGFELRDHNFEDRFHKEAWERIDKGQSFGYEDLVKLARVSEAGQMGLYEEMDDGSKLRFAVTYPTKSFLRPEDLQGALDFYLDELPKGMAAMADHPYSWSNRENPLTNPNLSADQIDAIVTQMSEIKCNPANMNAYYEASRIFRLLGEHPNCSEENKAFIQEYMDWMQRNDGSGKS